MPSPRKDRDRIRAETNTRWALRFTTETGLPTHHAKLFLQSHRFDQLAAATTWALLALRLGVERAREAVLILFDNRRPARRAMFARVDPAPQTDPPG